MRAINEVFIELHKLLTFLAAKCHLVFTAISAGPSASKTLLVAGCEQLKKSKGKADKQTNFNCSYPDVIGL